METKQNMIEKANKLIAVPFCYQGLKDAAQNWIDAVGTENEKASAKTLVDEAAADIMPIDAVIGFMKSEDAAKHFGADVAAGMAKHAEEIKAAGAVYCDCEACSAALDILNNKDAIL